MSRILTVGCIWLVGLSGFVLPAAGGGEDQNAAMLMDLVPQGYRAITVDLLNQLPAAGTKPARLQEPPPWALPTDVQFNAMGADGLTHPPNAAGAGQLKPAPAVQEPKRQ